MHDFDKQLWVLLRDGHLTFEQCQARACAKRGVRYVCADDYVAAKPDEAPEQQVAAPPPAAADAVSSSSEQVSMPASPAKPPRRMVVLSGQPLAD